MIVSLPFAKTSLDLNVPDENLMKVLTPNSVPGGLSGADEVCRSLQNPIGTGRLRDIVSPGEKVAIVTSDITRPIKSHIVLPPVLRELNEGGVPDGDITIIFALGSHRAQTEDEKRRLVGDEIFERIACIDSVGRFVHMGTTFAGTPVDIFEAVAGADRRVLLGNIEFHYFAGYSGGAKAIMPGVSTREAIQKNHTRMTEDAARAGRLDGNPIREDMEEVVREFCPVDFIVNVVLDERKNILRSFAGDVVSAHREGCGFLDRLYKVAIPKKADIVVVSAGGYPKDINLYQAQKALDNAARAVREGGLIIWVASAKEGLGEKVFEEWITGHTRPSDMVEHIKREFRLGGHKAAAIGMVLEKADIALFSDLEPRFVESIHLLPVRDVQAELDRALAKYGAGAANIGSGAANIGSGAANIGSESGGEAPEPAWGAGLGSGGEAQGTQNARRQDPAQVLVMPYGGSTLPYLQ